MQKSRDAVKIFSSLAIDSIASGDLTLLQSVLHEYLPDSSYPIKISDLFDLTLNKSAIDYKNEYYYKNTIANEIFLKQHRYKSATMLSEFRIASNKADCVILNNISTCYEIKTEFDNLMRLPEQLDSYIKIFDKVYVVVARNHIESVLSIIPKEVGVIELTPKGSLIEIYKATQLKTKIDPELMIQSLRMQEYMSIVNEIYGSIPTISNMKIHSYCLDKFRDIQSDTLRILFCKTLKKHRANNYSFIEKLPSSLITSAICYNITKLKQKALIDVLNTYINKDFD